jgi:divalent metal cation (Fe/Co/Zn/Cd) transporter
VAAALVLARWRIYGADAWLGLGVSLIVLYTAWVHLKSSISALLGEQPDAAVIQRIETSARGVHGVQDVHAVTVHDYGRRKVASLHVRLLSELPLEEAHRMATEVEQSLAQALDMSALVHSEPAGETLPKEHLDDIRRAVERLLIVHPSIVSFHALSVHPEDHGLEVEFHLHVPPATSIEAAHTLDHEVTALQTREFPELHVHVHIESCRLGCEPCHERCGVVVAEGSSD